MRWARRQAAVCGPFLFVAFVALRPLAQPTNLFVGPAGTNQFHNVQEAVMAVPSGTAERPVVIRIAPGTYKELIYVQREKRFFHFQGTDPKTTVLTFNLHAGIPGPDGKPIGTFRTASTVLDADDFSAENITFENSAGPVGQALAARMEGDRVQFRNCRFLGWQDTILANRGRHYLSKCYIEGHVDFIFGAATAYFDSCEIHCLKDGYITAASTPQEQAFGFVFNQCRITGEPEAKTFLGRPWRLYAQTAFLNCGMSDVVRAEGWNDWKKPEAHQTARYAEYHNTGPGFEAKKRVSWARQLSDREAKEFSPEKVLAGWHPFGL